MVKSQFDPSLMNGNGVFTRSRQLDFSSVRDDDQREEKECGSAEDGGQVKTEKCEAEEEELSATHRSGRGRRGTVFWSAEEEELLRLGVEKHGIGKWKKILTDGRDVFSNHRTNVDLKDKWANLSKNTRRKRRKTTGVTECPGSVEGPSRKSGEMASLKHIPTQPHRQAAIKTECCKARNRVEEASDEEASDEEELAGSDRPVATYSSRVAGSVTLKFATSKFPELVEVNVNLDLCKDVALLKEQLRSSILSDASSDANIQVIGLESRVLLRDDELLTQCITANGEEFFIVFESIPEEFV